MEKYLEETLNRIGSDAADSLKYEIVEVNIDQKAKPMVIDFIIYHREGVKIDDCATISHNIEEKLDQENILKDPYLLQVSSPGLDRPIKTQDDYRRNLGKKVEVHSYVKVENQKEFIGFLTDYNEKEIEITKDDDSSIHIPINVISKMNQFIEF